MKQVTNEVFENKKDNDYIMKTIAKAYLNNRECSVQKATYHIFRIKAEKNLSSCVFC